MILFPAKASTPGCTKACDFRDNLASLKSLGYVVLGVVFHFQVSRRLFCSFCGEERSLTFPLLSDAIMLLWLRRMVRGARKEELRNLLQVCAGEGLIRSTFGGD